MKDAARPLDEGQTEPGGLMFESRAKYLCKMTRRWNIVALPHQRAQDSNPLWLHVVVSDDG
jgi:hypothetical protein